MVEGSQCSELNLGQFTSAAVKGKLRSHTFIKYRQFGCPRASTPKKYIISSVLCLRSTVLSGLFPLNFEPFPWWYEVDSFRTFPLPPRYLYTTPVNAKSHGMF